MIRVNLNASNFISQSNAEEAIRSMKMDRDLDCRKESLLRREEARHRREQALAQKRRNTALDWGDIETRRRRLEAHWRNGFFKRETLQLQEFDLRRDESHLQVKDFKERFHMFQLNTEKSLRKTESEFPGMRKLREQYIKAAICSLEEGTDLPIEHTTIHGWLEELVEDKRITLLYTHPQPLNIKDTVRGEVMGKVVHFVGIGMLCLSTTYSSFFLLKEFDHRVWQANGMQLGQFTNPMSCLLLFLVYKFRASFWQPWERIKEKFMKCAKERCISWIKENAFPVTQVEFKESSKEVCMIRACRIMQKARPAVQEALQGIKAHRQRLLVTHRTKKDLLSAKEALQNMCKALRPVNKALRPLLPFKTSACDRFTLIKRWNQSCISEARRLVDKFWDFKLISCFFSQGRIKQAQIELVEQAYHLISEKSGLFPIEKELLLRIREIEEAVSETYFLKKLALFPIKNAEELLKEMKKRIVFQNNPTSLQKRCVEIIYLHVLDHGFDCDVQNQIDELFQDIVMPAKQEMINLHNYVFTGWANSA